jgi:hypothetical protein
MVVLLIGFAFNIFGFRAKVMAKVPWGKKVAVVSSARVIKVNNPTNKVLTTCSDAGDFADLCKISCDQTTISQDTFLAKGQTTKVKHDFIIAACPQTIWDAYVSNPTDCGPIEDLAKKRSCVKESLTLAGVNGLKEVVGTKPKNFRDLVTLTESVQGDTSDMKPRVVNIEKKVTHTDTLATKIAEKMGITAPAPPPGKKTAVTPPAGNSNSGSGSNTVASGGNCQPLLDAYNANLGIGQEAELCKATDAILTVYDNKATRMSLATCADNDDINRIRAKMGELEMAHQCVPGWRKKTFTYKCRGIGVPGDVCKAISNPIQAVVKVSTSCVVGAGISGDVAKGCDKYVGMNMLARNQHSGAVGQTQQNTNNPVENTPGQIGAQIGPGEPGASSFKDHLPNHDMNVAEVDLVIKPGIGETGIYGSNGVVVNGSGGLQSNTLRADVKPENYTKKSVGTVGKGSGTVGKGSGKILGD